MVSSVPDHEGDGCISGSLQDPNVCARALFPLGPRFNKNISALEKGMKMHLRDCRRGRMQARFFVVQQEGAVMKTSLFRLCTILTLATSMSAFAASGKSKRTRDGNCTTATDTKQASKNSDAGESNEGQSRQDPEKARQKLIEEQNQQWLHDLQGTSGG
jgi:hypothetical protein